MINTDIKNKKLMEKKQKQICRRSMKLFRKKGFYATTMREIAKATGIGLGNLYDYITKKEDILFLLHKDILSYLYQRFDQIMEESERPLEQLVNMIKVFFEVDSRVNEGVLFIYTETKSLERQYLHEILSEESKFISKIEAIVDRGIKEGVFDCGNAGLSANIIGFNMALLPLRGWNILPRYTQEQTRDDLIKFILRGLGVRKSDSYASSSLK